MNNEKQEQAKNLYFQTDLSKTQIADLLNISRRTLYYWIQQNSWERLKKSAAMMPSIIAEKCYMIMDNFTDSLLSEFRIKRPITAQEVDILHKLTLTIKKLKHRSTINENMEMFAYFMESINKKSPELALQVQPFVDEYITSQASVYTDSLKPEYFNQFGLIPQQEPDYAERKADAQDLWHWNEDNNAPIIDARDLAYKDAPFVVPNTTDETDEEDDLGKYDGDEYLQGIDDSVQEEPAKPAASPDAEVMATLANWAKIKKAFQKKSKAKQPSPDTTDEENEYPDSPDNSWDDDFQSSQPHAA